MGTPIGSPSSGPKPTEFQEPLLQSLAVLFDAKIAGDRWRSATSISRTLLEDHAIQIHWRTLQTVLTENRTLAGRRKRGRRWEFSILRQGEEKLLKAEAPILFVDPAQALQATVSLHNFFSTLTGVIRVCDPHIDHRTVEHLDACNPSLEVRLLTRQLHDENRLRRVLAAANIQGRNLTVKVAAGAPLHDRYVIDDSQMLILGASLNGFGKKQCFVISAGTDIRAIVLPAFDTHWAAGSVWT